MNRLSQTMLLGLLAGLMSMMVAPLADAAGSSIPLDQAQTNISNVKSLQRGARLYVNYCGGCHSAQYMRYRRLMEDLELTEDQVLSNLVFADAKIGDVMTIAMDDTQSAEWFGKAPPDLSLIARSRGVDWLYTYLRSFYADPSRPLGWNNRVYDAVSMPHVLWEMQGIQQPIYETKVNERGREVSELVGLELTEPGTMTPQEFDDAMRDLVGFLEYVGEPAKLKRESLGIWVLLYLVLFTAAAYWLKLEYWRDVH